MIDHLSNISRRRLLVGAAALSTTTALAATSVDAWAAGNANDRAWKWFRSKGLSTRQVSGIMGNFIYESGGTNANPVMNPKARQVNGSAIGIAQWDGSRKTDLINYAKSKGSSWESLRIQLYFAWHELTTTERRALDELKKTKTVNGATISFCDNYERPGFHNHDRRYYFARRVFDNRG